MANNKITKQNKQHKQQQGQQQPKPQGEFTVAIVLPQHLWGTINSVRVQDKDNSNKMVLLKLLQVNLPQEEMAEYAQKVTTLASHTPSFTLNFSDLVSEPSITDSTAVQVRLLPSADHTAMLCKLNVDLEAALVIKPSARAYVPFLHLVNVPKVQAEKFMSNLTKTFKPITITVQDLYFVARDGKDMAIRKSIRLSTPNSVIEAPIFDPTPAPPAIGAAKKVTHKTESPATNKDKAKEDDSESEIGPCYKFEEGTWTPARLGASSLNIATTDFTVATYNVLFDHHCADQIHTHLRVPAVLFALKELQADVIGLEEVTKSFLEKLLEEEWVRTQYFVSAMDVGYYGQLILSRFPFRSCQVNLGKPLPKKLSHTAKKAAVAEFSLNGKTTHVAVVHLTSDKSENASEKRKLQLEQVSAWMVARGYENFIIGDFNFGDNGNNCLPLYYEDVWSSMRPNEPGYTFEPTRNDIAYITSSTKDCRRFDRILCGSPYWSPKSISLFATDSIAEVDGVKVFPSDHYGVVSTFETSARLEVPTLNFSATSTVDPLYQFLNNKDLLPNQAYTKARREVLRFLEEAMADVFDIEEWKMHLIGSSLFGVDAVGSDVDVVVLGSMARDQFFDFAVKVLSAQDSVTDIRAITDALVPVIKLNLGGVQIDLQYCCMPFINRIPKRALDIDELTILRLDKASLVAINGVVDSELITNAAADFDTFRLALLFVKHWAKRRLIYSGSIGFLGGYPLAILVARIYELNPSLTPCQLVSKFFMEYGVWDIRTTPMSLPGVSFPTIDPKKHAIPIFTPSKPVRVASRNGTATTRLILSSELERAYDIFRKEGSDSAKWNELLAAEDITNYGANLLIVASTQNASDFSEWTGFVESRMVDIILQLERVLRSKGSPKLRPSDRKYACPQNPTTRAYFLVGVDISHNKCPEMAQYFGANLDFSAFSRGGANNGLLIDVDVISDVSSFVEGDNAVRASIKQKEKKTLPSVGQFNSVRAEGGLETYVEDTKVIIPPAQEVQVGTNNYADATKKKLEKKKNGEEVSEKRPRMRTSVEVFNRIMWDQTLLKSEFIIGYEDRFIGIMETPFDEFDLEAIPLHRIRIVKRSGVIVWSRNDRIDSLFKY